VSRRWCKFAVVWSLVRWAGAREDRLCEFLFERSCCFFLVVFFVPIWGVEVLRVIEYSLRGLPVFFFFVPIVLVRVGVCRVVVFFLGMFLSMFRERWTCLG